MENTHRAHRDDIMNQNNNVHRNPSRAARACKKFFKPIVKLSHAYNNNERAKRVAKITTLIFFAMSLILSAAAFAFPPLIIGSAVMAGLAGLTMLTAGVLNLIATTTHDPRGI